MRKNFKEIVFFLTFISIVDLIASFVIGLFGYDMGKWIVFFTITTVLGIFLEQVNYYSGRNDKDNWRQ